MAPTTRSPFVRDGEVTYVPVTEEFLKIHKVREWPVLEKDVCTFTHTYKADADVFLEHGQAIVTPKGKAPVKITAGDYAVLPAGMSCEWNIVEPVKEHYKEYE